MCSHALQRWPIFLKFIQIQLDFPRLINIKTNDYKNIQLYSKSTKNGTVGRLRPQNLGSFRIFFEKARSTSWVRLNLTSFLIKISPSANFEVTVNLVTVLPSVDHSKPIETFIKSVSFRSAFRIGILTNFFASPENNILISMKI